MSDSSFFTRLREVLNQNSLSQKKLAEMVGIDQRTISRWKKTTPSEGSIARIAMALNISAKWLTTGEGGKYLAQLIHEQPYGDDQSINQSMTNGNGNVQVGGSVNQPKLTTAMLVHDQPYGDASEDEEQNKFNQDMTSLLRMVTKWQEDENGADSLTSMNFLAEFHKRFPELQEWIKKQKGSDNKVSRDSKHQKRKTA